MGRVNRTIVYILLLVGGGGIILASFLIYLSVSVPYSYEPNDIRIDSEGVVTCYVNPPAECMHSAYYKNVDDSATSPWWIYSYNPNFEEIIDITGWAVVRGEEVKKYDMWVLLRAQDSDGKYLKLATELQNSDYLTQYFEEDNINYSNSGFVASVKKSFLDTDKQYDVYILYRNNEHNLLVDTKQVLNISELNNGAIRTE